MVAELTQRSHRETLVFAVFQFFEHLYFLDILVVDVLNLLRIQLLLLLLLLDPDLAIFLAFTLVMFFTIDEELLEQNYLRSALMPRVRNLEAFFKANREQVQVLLTIR